MLIKSEQMSKSWFSNDLKVTFTLEDISRIELELQEET